MTALLWILCSTILVSLVAFIGILTLSLKERILNKMLLFLVSLAAGVLMGGAFLHLIPEAVKKTPSVFTYVLLGFILFFLIEKILHWRHCHDGKCDIHAFAYLNLLGDSVHNFIDGLIIAASFIVSIKMGIATTLAILFHEIPQEISDFGVLVYGGFNRIRALFMNFLTAVTAVIGGLFGYFFLSSYNLLPYLLAFAAGGFIYISASDLLPEIRKEMDISKAMSYFVVFVIGIVLMWALRFVG